jgi:hypothetical protein
MTAKYRTAFLVVGGLFVVWGILALVDMGNIPYSGFSTDGNNTVTRVEAGSPAEAAGMRVGDRITSIEGISVEDSRALNRMGRAGIGETRTFVVAERAEIELAAGEEGPASREVTITFAGQPGRDVGLGWAAFVISLCFIGFGLMAYVKNPTKSAMLLALTGLCLGAAFAGGPYIGSVALRMAVGAITTTMVVLGFAFLLHCVSEFPKAKAILQREHMTKVLYAPAVLMALLFLWLIIFQPAATSTLNVVVNTLVGLFVVGYFGLALAALIHSYVTATPEERSRYGLNMVLGGLAIGLLPITIASLVGIFAPQVILPGADFYFLTMVLIPITMAMAIMRGAPAAEPTPAPVM